MRGWRKFYLWSVLREDADEFVSCVRVSSVKEGGADAFSSIYYLCKK